MGGRSRGLASSTSRRIPPRRAAAASDSTGRSKIGWSTSFWFQTHGEGAIRSATLVERALGAGAIVWSYLYKALLPVGLSFVYPQWQIAAADVRWWLPLAAAIAVTATLIWRRGTAVGRPILVAWIFYCVALAPVMGFADVYFMKLSLVADHYQYVALLGVSAAVAAAIDTLAARWRTEKVPLRKGRGHR